MSTVGRTQARNAEVTITQVIQIPRIGIDEQKSMVALRRSGYQSFSLRHHRMLERYCQINRLGIKVFGVG